MMKSIERNFNNISEKNPLWSTHTCFAKAVTGGNFTKYTLNRWFNKLVDKDDYAIEDKQDVLKYLQVLSSYSFLEAEDDLKEGINASRTLAKGSKGILGQLSLYNAS